MHELNGFHESWAFQQLILLRKKCTNALYRQAGDYWSFQWQFHKQFKSETFMHSSCSLLISGIHFYRHSLRKESARMSQVLFVDSVDRLTFHRPKPHFSSQKCPKAVFSSKEDVPMYTLWKKESIPTRIACDIKNVEKGHLAPSNLTFLLFSIDKNGFRRMKEEG